MRKTAFVVFFSSIMIMLSGCEPTPLVGSEDVFEHSDAQIVVAAYAIESNQFVASGTVKNGGTLTYAPPWYLEAKFYSDSTLKVIFGGTNKTFTFSLGSGETTFWELRYAPQGVDVNNFPDFRVSGLRAYRNKN